MHFLKVSHCVCWPLLKQDWLMFVRVIFTLSGLTMSRWLMQLMHFCGSYCSRTQLTHSGQFSSLHDHTHQTTDPQDTTACCVCAWALDKWLTERWSSFFIITFYNKVIKTIKYHKLNYNDQTFEKMKPLWFLASSVSRFQLWSLKKIKYLFSFFFSFF